MRFSPNHTALAGVPRDTLVIWLAQAQQALADLYTGSKVVSLSYEGKQVSYTPSDVQRLTEWISIIQSQISGKKSRRALRPVF
jgi:flavin-dependent dehydrogenase